MAWRLDSLVSRVALMLLLIHAAALPSLYFVVIRIVETTVIDRFLDDARSSGQVIADTFDVDDLDFSSSHVRRHLDSILLGGHITYASLRRGERVVRPTVQRPGEESRFVEDFEFGEHGDDTYFISVPIDSGEPIVMLRLGFDEIPTAQGFAEVRDTVFWILTVYAAVSLVVAAFLSTLIVRPIRRLQEKSRDIISGDYQQRLVVSSNSYEIRELSFDLETMRDRLVGVNEQLKAEIAEREEAQQRQAALESRLRHAQRLDSLGTLAGGVAHEFNNILQPLVLYAEMAVEDIEEETSVREHLEEVIKLANRASVLSRQILTFGKHRGKAAFSSICLAPVVEEAVTMVNALLPATVDIRSYLEGDVCNVFADPLQVQQLIVNLCSNAYQALQHGRGHIEVRLYGAQLTNAQAREFPQLEPGEHAMLEVEDTGKGMEEDTLQRMFEPFYSTKEVGEGTGLGLSVVHGIMKRHGGEIVVRSQPGKGSRFTMYFPKANKKGNEDGEDSGNR